MKRMNAFGEMIRGETLPTQPSGISLGSQKKKTMPRLLVPIEKDLKL
jgi:hypothetical protein